MRVADYIFKTLADKGVEHTFLFVGSEPMHSAAVKGQMTVYKHEGFWRCVDNIRSTVSGYPARRRGRPKVLI